jgi:hypothetical protein
MRNSGYRAVSLKATGNGERGTVKAYGGGFKPAPNAPTTFLVGACTQFKENFGKNRELLVSSLFPISC